MGLNFSDSKLTRLAHLPSFAGSFSSPSYDNDNGDDDENDDVDNNIILSEIEALSDEDRVLDYGSLGNFSLSGFEMVFTIMII